MEMPKWVKWLFGLAVFIAATVGIVWLSGFVFFLFSKANPFGKTDFSTWWTYWQFYQNDPVVAKRLTVSMIVAAAVGYGVPIVLTIAALRDVRTLHGEARFAKTPEIAKAGLFDKTGIIIGKWKNRFLMFAGMQFVLLAAPTRSGKGVGIVIPNLLNWAESVVAMDVKLENFLITSKFRRKWGQEVYLFNPFSIAEDAEGNPLNGKTHRYNPLGYISDDPRMRVTDILAIGYSLYPGEGRDAFFDDAARNLFLGLTLYLCETPTLPRTIGELLRQSSGKGQPIKDHLQGIINQRNYREVEEVDEETGEITKTLVPLTEWDGEGLPPLSSECVDAINRFTSTSDNTLSSIMATFNVPLTMWASPIVDAATSANDFDLRDVRKRRMSIYLGIPANKLAEAKLLINLFYTQLVNLNTNQLLHATPELKYQCLILADEFTAPGRIGIIDKANSYMAGYGLRLLTIIQSPGQLEAEPPKGYGRENARTFVTNHACQIFYTPREQRDANEYSEALGYMTVHSKNKSNGRGGTSLSESIGEGAGQRRALMLPQELKEMSQREQIISLENTKPIRCEKIAYYADHAFMDRLKSVSPTLAKLGRKLPSKKQLEDVWGSGELASPVPSLDLDLHEAVVQSRIRELTTADVEKGIDLRKLALNTSALKVASGSEGIAPEQVEDFVNGFFDALDAVNEYDDEEIGDDGIGERPSDDELAALDAEPDAGVDTAAQAQAEADDVAELDNALDTALDADTAPTAVAVDVDTDDDANDAQDAQEAPQALPASMAEADDAADDETVLPDGLDDLPSDDELAAMMDAAMPGDDGMPDEADMLAALDAMEEPPMLDDEPAPETESRAPLLDLGVLDKPLPSTKNAG